MAPVQPAANNRTRAPGEAFITLKSDVTVPPSFDFALAPAVPPPPGVF
jgi:hypothetical protein